MKRVASLYLPYLPIERLWQERSSAPPKGSSPQAELGGRGTTRRVAEGSSEPEPSLRRRLSKGSGEGLGPQIGERIEDCSCPRGGHWRPGARWAENSKERMKRAELQARIDAMPAHQRPPIRELGRRSEAAEVPFRKKEEDRSSRAKSRGVCDESVPAPLDFARDERNSATVVTSHRSGQRITIAAASRAARALGLSPGMPLTQARALVPGLDVRPSDPEGDAAWLARLAEFAACRWTPAAAVSGTDGLFLDLTGTAHLFGGEERFCARILRFCARLGFSARIAVAGSYGAAHALARHGGADLLLCPVGGEAKALTDLPINALRIEETLLAPIRRLGVDRVGELAALPRAPLARRFGNDLLVRIDQALGRTDEPFDPLVPADAPVAIRRLVEPISTAEAIDRVLGDLLDDLVATLERQGIAPRMLTLVCDRLDGDAQRVAVGTARATRDAAHLHRLLAMKIEEIDPGFGIEAMRLVAGGCEPLGPQQVPGALAGEKPAPDLSQLIDRLAGRLGARRLIRWSAVESDVPERSLRRVSPLEEAQDWPNWPRPVRLLDPPEPVDKVVALLPDGAPRRFRWRGRSHRVVRADGPERIHGEWWRRAAEADAVRDYFQVEDEAGARFWLYRRGDGADGRTGDMSWWLQGVFG